MKDIGTPQSKEVARKVNSDMEWQKVRFGGRDITGEMVGGIFIPKS